MESPDILMNSGLPVVTAFVLGLLTAISPCPLATNITAIGFISRDIGNRKRIFRNGLLYTLGRIITYTVLGLLVIPILREGASMFAIQKGISQWGEWIISPLLLLTGGFMLWGQRLNLPKFGFSGDNEKLQNLKGGVGSLTLGILFALAFCPTSGVFYFGLLIPMAAISTGGMWFPVVCFSHSFTGSGSGLAAGLQYCRNRTFLQSPTGVRTMDAKDCRLVIHRHRPLLSDQVIIKIGGRNEKATDKNRNNGYFTYSYPYSSLCITGYCHPARFHPNEPDAKRNDGSKHSR